MQTEFPQRNVTTWTLLVRITHWLVAIGVLINFFNESGFWHRFIGYGCLGLVLLRICDGLWMSRHSTSQFYLPCIADIKTHVKELVAGRISTRTGHNPLGQYAVYSLWLLIILLTLTGWVSRTDQYWGVGWPIAIHSALSCALQSMVVLHLLAVLAVSKLQGRNLIRAMIYGK